MRLDRYTPKQLVELSDILNTRGLYIYWYETHYLQAGSDMRQMRIERSGRVVGMDVSVSYADPRGCAEYIRFRVGGQRFPIELQDVHTIVKRAFPRPLSDITQKEIEDMLLKNHREAEMDLLLNGGSHEPA